MAEKEWMSHGEAIKGAVKRRVAQQFWTLVPCLESKSNP